MSLACGPEPSMYVGQSLLRVLVGDEAGTWSSGDWSWVESGGDAKVGDGEVWVGGGVSNDMTGLSRSEL